MAAGALKDSIENLIIAMIDKTARVAREKVEEWGEELEERVAESGPGAAAILAGGRAKAAGKNPALAAVKGGFGAMSTGMKVLTIVAAILLLLLAPVLAVLLLLALPVLAIVTAVRSGPKTA